MKIWVDHCLPHRLAQCLCALDVQAVSLLEQDLHTANDVHWLKEPGEPVVVLTTDDRIKRRVAERQAVFDGGHTLILVPGKARCHVPWLAGLLLLAMDDIQAAFEGKHRFYQLKQHHRKSNYLRPVKTRR